MLQIFSDKISTIDDVTQTSHGRGQSSAKDVALREKLPHATLAKPLKVSQKHINIFIPSVSLSIKCRKTFLVASNLNIYKMSDYD